MLEKYNQKTLRIDAETKRRIDLIQLDPGYRDVTNAYHDSVEECLVLSGELDLSGEGHFAAGDYFWRPPGFVHAADSPKGFSAILSLQGEDRNERSAPTSRRIRPDIEAGMNQLYPNDPERTVGPRGWVRCLTTSLVTWQPGPVFLKTEGVCYGFDPDRVEFKSLSRKPWTGGQSMLMRLGAGYAQVGEATSSSAWEFFVESGSCAIGDEPYGAGVYGYLPAGSPQLPLTSETGAVLFVKTDGWVTRLPA